MKYIYYNGDSINPICKDLGFDPDSVKKEAKYQVNHGERMAAALGIGLAIEQIKRQTTYKGKNLQEQLNRYMSGTAPLYRELFYLYRKKIKNDDAVKIILENDTISSAIKEKIKKI